MANLHPVQVLATVALGLLPSCAGTPTVRGIEALTRRAPGPGLEQRIRELERAAYRGRDLPRAEKLARELLTHDPHLAAAHEALAFASLLRGDHEAARRHFARAALDGAEPHPYVYLRDLVALDYTARDVRGTAELMRAVSEDHPNRDVRQFAAHLLGRLLRRQGRFEQARRVRASRAMLSTWSAIGGFDNDQHRGFQASYPPERAIALDQRYPGQRWPIRWRRVKQLTPGGLVNLRELLSPVEWNVAYLLTYVHSPRSREATLHLSSTDAFRVWLNDGLVASQQRKQRLLIDDVKIPVRLRRGWNKLLIKSAQQTGNWALGARLSSSAGRPLALQSSAAPRPYQRDLRPAQTWSVERGLQRLLPRGARGPRRLFLSAYLAWRMGLAPTASQLHDRYAVAARGSPLSWYFGALAYWRGGQDNKAANFLRLGAKRIGETYPAFLVKRARWFNQRSQWRKATGLLRAALRSRPGQRRWRLALARQYHTKGWYEESLTILRRLTREAPDDPRVQLELGRCLGALGRRRLARAAYRRALRLDPSSRGARKRLRTIARRAGELARAIQLTEELRDLDPTRADPYVTLGDLHRRAGMLDRAVGYYERARQMDGQWAKPLKRLGAVAAERGQRGRAIALWKRALVLDPEDSNLWERVETFAPPRQFVLSRHVMSERDVLRELARARRFKPHPDASAVYLIDEEIGQWLVDGTSRSVITTAIKILDARARQRYGRKHLGRSGYLQLHFAFVLGPRGERTDVSSIRNRQLRFPKLKVGSIIVCQYMRHISDVSFQRNERHARWWLQQRYAHVRRSRWLLITNKEVPFHVHVQGPVKRGDRVITHEGERLRVTTFTSRDVPPLLPQGSNRNPTEYLARVFVSTVKDWDSFAKWTRAMFDEAIQVTPEIEEVAARVAPARLSTRERVRAIYRFMVQRIRYQQDYAFKIEGVKPHLAPMVLQRSYGDCKDKTVLLISLLRAIGVEAHYSLVLTTRHGRVYPEVPAQQFNHVITHVPRQRGIERPLFLDPTAEFLDLDTVRFDDQGALALVIDRRSHRFVKVPHSPAEANLVEQRVKVDLGASDSPGSASFHCSARGLTASFMRRSAANLGAKKRLVRSLFTVLFYNDATLESHSTGAATAIDRPFRLEGRFRSPGLVRRTEEGVQVTMPTGMSRSRLGRWKERNLPLHFTARRLSRITLEVILPDDLVHDDRAQPRTLEVKHRCLSYRRQIEVQQGRVVRTDTQQVTCIDVPVDQYAAFKKVWDELVTRSSEPLMLRRRSRRARGRGH